MSAVNQKEYLKRYLSKNRDKKKKKKKKAPKGIQNRVKIIDDNLDIQEHIQTIQDIENNDEDAPQVVAVIDDRPVELRLDSFKDNSNWTTVEIKPEIKKEPEDTSPSRSSSNANGNTDYSISRKEKSERVRDHSESDDYSPPRKSQGHKDNSPPRRGHNDDFSPPRRQHRDSDESPPRRRQIVDSSPPRKRKGDYSSPRKRNSDNSSSRRRNIANSPPRKKTTDCSPPRKRITDSSSPRKRNIDSSPLRRRNYDNSPSRSKNNDLKENNSTRNLVERSPKSKKTKSRWGSRSPEPELSTTTQNKATKTLDGKAAGLQNAKDLIKETENFKKREAKLFESMSAEVSGVGSSTVIRDRKTGKIRDLEAEALLKAAHKEKASALKKQYDEWGKGVKQTADYKAKLQQDAYEMTKPLARYADDEDLERHLKEQERLGDPMLEYIRKKKRENAVAAGVPLKPLYEGAFMPNRYGIRPGHKWDGVERSNGYEKKWFDAINKRNAQREEAYKWNSEDM